MSCFSIITDAIENEAICLFDDSLYTLARQEMILKLPYGIKKLDFDEHAVVSVRLSLSRLTYITGY